MSLLPTIGAVDQDTGFYNEEIDSSVRFQSAHMSRTPGTAGNQAKWTFSTWFKIANPGANHTIFSAGASNSNRVAMFLNSGGQFSTDKGGVGTYFTSVQRFRDTSAWYNLVWHYDSANGTTALKNRMWVNGVEITLTVTRSFGNSESWNATLLHTMGGLSNSTATYASQLYLADTNFVDNSLEPYTNFGELKNGVWIPIEPNISEYGTTGFRLQYKNTGTETTGAGTTATTNIGDDSSGKGNNWAVTGFGTQDSNMPDSPENNFATMNPLNARRNGYTLTEGNLKSTPSMAYSLTISTFANKSGLFYFEVLCLLKPSSSNNMAVGFDTLPALSTTQYIEKGVWDGGGVIAAGDGASFSSNVGGYTTGDILSVAYNLDTGKGWFRENDGDWVNSGNPANDSGNIFTFTSGLYYTPAFMGYNTQSGTLWVANYGQDSSFAGNKTSGSANAQDLNGIGDFYYAPPSGGFLALCSANLPEPTIGANSTTQATDHFNTVLWTGNGGTQSITGVGFKPDWIWIKNRSNALTHALTDSSRGKTKQLASNSTGGDQTTNDGITAFGTDGFSLGAGTEQYSTNTNNHTYVGWNWKANGGTTSTLTAGTIDSVVQANTTAGFSIVTYTGDDQARATVAHGLSQAPEMIIVKNRDEAISNPTWPVYHASNTSAPATDYLDLYTTGKSDDAETIWSDEVPTDTLVILGTADSVNSGSAHVMYCFHSVEGYSKFGTYTGNNIANGPFVYLGFRPAWIMTKNYSSAGGSWGIYDNTRNSSNTGGTLMIRANEPDGDYYHATYTPIDFLSNGFKIRNTGGEDNTAQSFIYMAFAEQPFKYANAR